MKKSYEIEIVIGLLFGIAGALIAHFSLWTWLIGSIIAFFTSYFLVSKLKLQTIKEYIEIKTEEKLTNITTEKGKGKI